MAREPHYPDDDAAIGGDARRDPATRAPDASEPRAPAGQLAAAGKDGKRTKQLVAGAAIGIGSAAIVAALLYAKSRGRSDKT